MIKAIFKKEMIDILRDKKTLFMGIILPLILYPILMVVVSQIMIISMESMEKEDVYIAFSKTPKQELVSIINNIENDETGNIVIKDTEDYEKDLEDGKIQAYIKIEESENTEKYNIYMISSKIDVATVTDKLEEVFTSYKENLVKNKLEEFDLDIDKTLNPVNFETFDIAKNEEIAGSVLGQILPFILIMGILLGAIYPAIDCMAGEKERGTLETLFTLPISNLELIMGKYMAVSLCAIVTALLNILSISLSIVFLLASGGMMENMLGADFAITQLLGPLFITLICVCMFAMVVSALSMCVCSLAKTFKDAQNYITPIMLLILIPSYASMIPNMKLNTTTSVIPVVNISLLIKSVFNFEASLGLIAMVFISNIAFVIISVVLLSKIFNSEDVLFGSGKSFSFLEKRSNIKKGTMPSVSDGIILYAIELVLLIYIGTLVQLKFGMVGLVMTQVMIVGIPLLFTYYIKSDFKKVFSIKLPSFKHIIGAISLWIGTYIVVMIITQVLLHLFPENMKVVEGLNEVLFKKDSLIFNLLIVAVMPAICEEILFRGFILTSFKNNKKSYVGAIVVSGLLFGMMHMDFIRIIPTALLGISFAYAVVKTNSIFIGMFMHFINNGLAVVVTHFYSGSETNTTPLMSILQISILIGISFIFICLAVFLLRKKEIN